jgi:hypothetical protein
MSDSRFSPAFSDQDRIAFINDISVRPGFGDRANIEEVTLHWTVDGASYGTAQANQDIDIQPLLLAAAAVDSQTRTRRSQDPKIDGSGKLPGSLVILVGALGMRVDMSELIATAVPFTETTKLKQTAPGLDEINAVTQMMEGSYLELGNGSVRRIGVTGDLCTSYGVSRAIQAIYDSTGAAIQSGALTEKDDSFLRVKPFELGSDQQVDLHHYVHRVDALPSDAFSVRYWMHCLIARTK